MATRTEAIVDEGTVPDERINKTMHLRLTVHTRGLPVKSPTASIYLHSRINNFYHYKAMI